jgi:putative ABC transport system ATP-binding protein
MTTDALIYTQNLRKSFTVGTGTVEVLKGINVTVKKGEFVIIFGPSGCGKSTLLHSLLGLEPPTEGKIVVDGQDFYSLNEDERALFRRHKVGMIYQQPLWIGSFNVLENVTFPLHLLGIPQAEILKKAIDALTAVGLEKWAVYHPRELSSGQQQKISLARSLMTDPLIIVADEPTGNLDTVSGQELLETFMKLVKGGKTIIMVTHDLEYLKYATKIFHMVDGEVVEEYSSKHKIQDIHIEGKKEIGDSNVRDKDFLKKLKL